MRDAVLRMVFKQNAVQNASSAMLPSNKTVGMAICYCKQKLAMLDQPLCSSDWPTSLELTLMSGAVHGNSFNLTQLLKNAMLMCKTLQNTRAQRSYTIVQFS